MAAFRTWSIRLLILTVLASIGYGIWWMQSYVSPDAVRTALLSTFSEQFPNAEVHVSSAHIRVFGGISIRDLTLTNRGETEPFFVAPTSIIYHDKEQINRGRLVIRKIDLDAPTFRIERGTDGKWAFEGLLKPGSALSPLPTFVVTKATIVIVDRSPNALPRITLSDASFTIVNDPAPVFLNIKANGVASVADNPLGKCTLMARINRSTGQSSLRTEVPDLAIGPSLIALLARWVPEAAAYEHAVSGKAAIKAELSAEPNGPLVYDVRLQLKDGRFQDALLPSAIEKIETTIHVKDGVVIVEKATGQLGNATLELSLETKSLSSTPIAPIPPSTPGVLPAQLVSSVRRGAGTPVAMWDRIEDKLVRIEVALRDLVVDDALFERLPSEAGTLRSKFQPTGIVSLGYKFQRLKRNAWQRDFEVRPVKMRLAYEKFRYPLTEVAGLIKKTTTNSGSDETKIDLAGTGSGQRIEVKGTVSGDGPDPFISLKISGNNIPVNEQLFAALPGEKYAKALRKLHASGRGDFVAEVRQLANVNKLENVIRIQVYDGAIDYTLFPYPIEKASGKIAVYVTTTDAERSIQPGGTRTALPDTDHIELREFTGRHAGGNIWLKGDIDPIPGSLDRKLAFSIWGRNCPINDHLRAALTAIKLDNVWRTFSPRGQLTFAVDVDIIDRVAVAGNPTRPPLGPVLPPGVPMSYGRLMGRDRSATEPSEVPFNPATDLKLAFHFEGPSVTPDFFPVVIDRLAGRLKYDGTQVKLEHFSGMHGGAKLKLNAADVRFYDGGQVWANIGKLEIAPLIIDDEILNALPSGLRRGVKEMNLSGPAELMLNHLVVLTTKAGKPGDEPRALPKLPPTAMRNTSPIARGQAPDSFSQTNEPVDPDVFWNGELRLMGASFDIGVPCEQAAGKLAISGRYHGTHLGKVAGNLWLDRALIAQHPVTAVKATFDADPQTTNPSNPGELLPVAFKFTDLTGSLFRGTVGGTGRVVLSDPVRYRLALTATDVRLEEIAQHHNLGNGVKLEGAAQGNILIETVPDPRTGAMMIEGYGKADVDRGHILNLPVMMPLLKTLKLQAPDKTAFEEAHATFTIRGDRVRVEHLDLLGSAISLGGSGEIDMAGDYVKFDFYTILSQTLQRWLTTPFGDVTAAVSEKLFKIEVVRKDGELKYEPRIVPFVTAPFRAIADRMKVRK